MYLYTNKRDETMSIKLKEWLTKRREEKVIKLLEKHMASVIDTVYEFYNAIKFLKDEKVSDARKSLIRMSQAEEEADKLDRLISAEATKGDIPPKFREDLMHLVRRVDLIADWTKDAGNNILLLIDKEIQIPNVFLEKTLILSKLLKDCVNALQKAIVNITVDLDKALTYVEEVEVLEHKIDIEYYNGKKLLLDLDLHPGILITIRDMLNDVEHASDLAEDAGDVIKILAVREK